MSKIIYGVSGEGSGHSSRAREMAGYLRSQGHSLKIVSYGRGYANLKDDFDCLEIQGLHIASEENKVSKIKTFTENMKKLPDGYKKLKELKALFKSFQPNCVITDFEPLTAYLANHYHVPLITLDNQHRMRYMKYDMPSDLDGDRMITELVIKGMVPKPDVSLVTTFYQGELKNNRTFLFPPILRQQVVELTPTDSDHILVYLTSGFDQLLELLRGFKRERFLVYGYDKEEQQDNLHFRPFSKTVFLNELAAAKAVIATAGFTLMSEAFYLQKPYLALPMRGQFEQQLNGVCLEMAGFGLNAPKINADKIGHFLYRLGEYRARLPENNHHYREYLAGRADTVNYELCRKLDELFASDMALLKSFYRD